MMETDRLDIFQEDSGADSGHRAHFAVSQQNRKKQRAKDSKETTNATHMRDALDVYMNEIWKHAVLTRSEETALASKMVAEREKMTMILADSLLHLWFVYRVLRNGADENLQWTVPLFLIDADEERAKDWDKTLHMLIEQKIDTFGAKITAKKSHELTSEQRLELMTELSLSWDGYRKLLSTAEKIIRELHENPLRIEKLKKHVVGIPPEKIPKAQKIEYEKKLEEQQNLLALIGMPEADFLEFYRRLHDVSERAHKLRSDLVNHNLKLVVSIARQGRSLTTADDYRLFSDLIQEGNLGLIGAIERFDPKLGNKLSTYAGWWIKQKIQRHLKERERIIRIPTKTLDMCRTISRTKQEFYAKNGRYPNDEEVSLLLGLPLKMVAKLNKYQIRIDRLEDPVTSEGDMTIGDIIASEPEAEENTDLIREVRKIIVHLTTRERIVLENRFGMGQQDESLTLETIGGILWVTRERVRQIEDKAMKKLRKLDNAPKLRELLR